MANETTGANVITSICFLRKTWKSKFESGKRKTSFKMFRITCVPNKLLESPPTLYGAMLLCSVLCLMLQVFPCRAQVSTIGIIEIYGLRHVSEVAVRQTLQLAEGDPVPASKPVSRAIIERLRALPGIVKAQLSNVCCVAGKTVLFVGIEERGTRAPRFRAAPQGAIRLQPEIIQAGEDFDKALMEAVTRGDSSEDDSHGYAMMHYPAAHAIQERFLLFAERDLNRLRDVLRYSADAAQRALAAQVLGYAAAGNRTVVNDLVLGVSDPDSEVRNNATRALAVRAIFAQKFRQASIRIPYQPFIRLTNSLDWTDRNKACFALLQLSEKRDPVLLRSLRKQSLPALKDMAQWKRSGYGKAAFILLGRIGSLSEEAIVTAWKQGDYATVLTAIEGA